MPVDSIFVERLMHVPNERDVEWWQRSLFRGLIGGDSHRAQLRKQNNFSNRCLISQEHREAINANAESAGRGHSIFQRGYVILVHWMCLVVPGTSGFALFVESCPLISRVVEFSERIANLKSTDVPFESLDEISSAWSTFRQR